MIKSINQILVFILEMIMLFSYGYFGMTRQWNFSPKLLFTFLFVSAAIILWSIFAAPKSGRRLAMPYLSIFRMLMFSLSAFLLVECGYKNFGMIVFIFSLVTQAMSLFTEQSRTVGKT
jgi:uncharacterized protein DUF2568